MRLYAALLLLLVCPGLSQAADIAYQPSNAAMAFITLDDVIVPGDHARFKQALAAAQATGKPVALRLNSRGGDVDEAMAIGRTLRQAGGETFHRQCDSSCIFIFMAGVKRHTQAGAGDALAYTMLLHRPELGDAHVNSPSAFTAQMMNMLKIYMSDMVGSDALYDDMMQVPFAAPRPVRLSEARQTNLVTDIGR